MRTFIYCLLTLCILTACSTTQQVNTAQVITNNAVDSAKVVADSEIDKVLKKEEESLSRLERVVSTVRPDESAGGPYIPPEAQAPKASKEEDVIVTGIVKRHVEDPGEKHSSGIKASGPIITIVTRSFIYPNDNVIKAPMNVILFPHKPVSKAETETYKNICEIYLSYFPETEEVVDRYKADDTVKVLPIFWMLKKKTDGSCEQLVKNYDYTRAQIFIDTNHLATDKIQIVCQLKKATITMDISSVEKEEDLQLSFDMWKKKMCKVPNKNTRVYAYDLYSSAKEVLGALSSLIAFK